MATSWEALYRSSAQGPWALGLVPIVFLGWLVLRGAAGTGVEPRAEGFVRRWAVAFALIALIDVFFAGPLGAPRPLFPLLGNYRVFALALVVMQPTRARPVVLLEALAWTLVAPAFASGLIRLAEAVAVPQSDMMRRIVQEVAFVALVDAFVAWVLPRRVAPDREPVRRYLRAVLGFVVLYYALWALSDIVILGGDDRGWGLRLLPNQLYYGLFVPFAYARFFSRPAAPRMAEAPAPPLAPPDRVG